MSHLLLPSTIEITLGLCDFFQKGRRVCKLNYAEPENCHGYGGKEKQI
jgi:hypothetical protein